MLSPEPQLLLDHKCELGDGPIWDAHNNQVLWIDIVKGEIHHFNPHTEEFGSFHVNEMVGAIALRKKGGLIAALQFGFAKIDLQRRTVLHLIDPESDIPTNRFNDGKCDPQGRFWA